MTRRHPRRWLPAVGALGALAGGLAGWLADPRHPWGSAPPPVPLAAAPPGQIVPEEAWRAYAGAMASLRDGLVEAAMGSLRRAVEIAPTFAAARLRLSVWQEILAPGTGRAVFQEARPERGRLDARDRRLLDAVVPALAEEAPDWEEAARRLVVAARSLPRDAELLLWTHHALVRSHHPDEARRALDEAIEVDRGSGLAWLTRGLAQARSGDAGGALATLEECLSHAPAAVTCRRSRLDLLRQIGACDAYQAEARRWIVLDPKNPASYFALASSLAATPRSLDTVETTLAVAAESAVTPGARAELASLRTRLAILRGQLGDALRQAEDLGALAAGAGRADLRADAARLRVELLVETGDLAAARDLAEETLRDEAASAPDLRPDDGAIVAGAGPDMWRALRLAESAPADSLAARRDAWLAAARGRLPVEAASELWRMAYPPLVETAEEARAALEVMPLPQGIPSFRPTLLREGAVGRAYRLAGRLDDALRWVAAAAGSCGALDHPIEHTRAFLELGTALAATGERDAACRASGVVLARWGAAEPAPATATSARDLGRALGCAGPPSEQPKRGAP